MVELYRKASQMLHYDPQSGVFTWLVDRGQFYCFGKKAGSENSDGYRSILVSGRRILEHRLAWFSVFGVIPDQIDHMNRNPSDNRLSNLRPCNQNQNHWNRGRLRSNTSGVTGVVESCGRWQARITVNRKRLHLGTFKTKREAVEARRKAEAIHHENWQATHAVMKKEGGNKQ